MVRFPWGEVAVLPGSVLLSSAGLLGALVRILDVTTALPISQITYVAVAVVIGIGAFFSCLTAYFGFPIYARLFDLTAALGTGLLLVERTTPDGPEENLLLYILLALLAFSWFMASYTAMVVVRLLPAEIPRRLDHALQKRLHIEQFRRRLYSYRNANMAGELGRNRVVDTLTLLSVFIVITSIFQPISVNLGQDIQFARWVGLCLAGVLTYSAIVRLATQRRLAERDESQITIASYSAIWGLGVLVPILLGLSLALMLPADISPLNSRNWISVWGTFLTWWAALLYNENRMSNIERQFGGQLRPTGSAPPSGTGVIATGQGPLDPIAHIWGFWALALLLFFVVAGILYLRRSGRTIWSLFFSEVERSQGLLSVLRSLLLWPWHAVKRWWLRRRHQEQNLRKQADEKAVAPPRGKPATRFLPVDAVLFVRFVYRRFLRSACKAGVGRQPTDTAHEYAAYVGSVCPENKEAVEELTTVYCRARYRSIPTGRGKVVELLRRSLRRLDGKR